MIMNTFEARKEQIKRNKTTHFTGRNGTGTGTGTKYAGIRDENRKDSWGRVRVPVLRDRTGILYSSSVLVLFSSFSTLNVCPSLRTVTQSPCPIRVSVWQAMSCVNQSATRYIRRMIANYILRSANELSYSDRFIDDRCFDDW